MSLKGWQGYAVQLEGTKPARGLSLSFSSLPLLEANTTPLAKQAKVDPENWTVELKEMVHEVEVKTPITLDLDEYLRLRREIDVERLWRESRKEWPAMEGVEEGEALRIDIPVKFPKVIGRAIGQGGQLKVTGSRRIAFSGRSEWTEGEVQTATSRPSKFPSLNMEQRSKFTIEGTVGQKVHVLVDQDSERLNELENSIRIRYDGDEDEVIQEIEGGNIALSLPNTEFSGYSQQHQGLFGLRTRAKIGDLDLVAIASQEKGSGEKASFRAGAEEKFHRIKDIDYLGGTYFFLDSTYRDQYSTYEHGLHTYNPADSIVEIEVYVDDGNSENNAEKGAVSGRADVDPEAPDDLTGHLGYFHPLQPDEYFIDRRMGFIALDKPIQDGDVLAVAYRTPRRTEGYVFPDSVRLKLIKPENPRPSHPTWKYEWKNVYYLGAKNINEEGFELKIYLDLPSGEDEDTQDGVSFLQIFGLDKYDLDGNPNPDERVDLVPEIVNLQRGELIFPDLQPFALDTLDVKVEEIYKAHDYRTKSEASRYYIEVKHKNRQATYSLGKVNIIEGSEVVTLNGRRLRRGVDYDIIYETGQITFLTDEALNPNADITVDFEYAPFFVPEQKTLLGLRGEYHFWDGSSIGSTILYRDQTTIDRKVKLGGEPSRNFLWDANLALEFKPRLMTDLVDALPFVETDSRSALDISAEVAQSIPDPNTKGEAFIDDFEGCQRETSLGVMRGAWTKSSLPEAMADTTRHKRGKLVWYNPWDQVDSKDIWPNIDPNTPAEERTIHVLALELTPDGSPPESSWGGLMRALPVSNFDQSRSEYIELWVKGEKGTICIDLGAISEDAIPNGELDTEDEGRNALERNGVLDENEDIGLDGMAGIDPTDFWDLNGNGVQDPGEPTSWDDWNYDDKYDYSRINGTEGNRNDPDRGPRPDTEDINGNGILDTDNDYFEYAFELGDSVYINGSREKNPYIKGGWNNPHGWRLYRIPLDDPVKAARNRNLSLIEFVRLWVTGVDSKTEVQIATFDIVGNNWEELGVSVAEPTDSVRSDESFDITVKNTHENEDYSPPPGVSGERDVITKVEQMEQSLVLVFKNLGPGHTGSAYRAFYSNQDFTGYHTLRMYVHGDSEVDTTSTEFFFRFGADSSNYYEYRAAVYPGWDARNEVAVDLDEIANLKFALLNSTEGSGVVPDTTVGRYRVHGHPSFTNIRYLETGVRNNGLDDISGETWVDELRLTDPRRDRGWATRATVRAKFADFADLRVNFRRQTADFHGVRESWGTGRTSTASDLRAGMELDKFFPRRWGLSIPLDVSWTEKAHLPKYEPGSDVILGEDERWRQRTTSTSRTLRVSFKKTKPSPRKLVHFTLDRTSLSFSAADKKSLSPTYPDRKSIAYNGSVTYDLTPRKSRSLPLFGWVDPGFLPPSVAKSQFYYLPSRLIFSSQIDRVKSYSVNRHLVRTDNYTCYLTEKVDAGYDPLRSLSTDYTLRLKQDSRWARLDRLDFGREIERVQTASLLYRPKIFRWSTQSFSYRANYHENNNIRSRTGATSGRNVYNSSTQTIRVRLDPSRALGWLFRPGWKEKAKPGSPASLLLALNQVVERMSSVSATHRRVKRFSWYRLSGRPSLGYQLGFTDVPGVESEPGVGETNREHRSKGWDLKVGFEPIRGVNLTTMYEYDYSINKTSTARTDKRGVTFPKLILHWRLLGRMPMLRDAATSSSLDFGYWKKKDNAWITDPATGVKAPDSKGETDSFSPLFSWTTYWRNGVRTTFEADRTKTERTSGIFRGTKVTTESEANTYTASIDYSFSAPQGISIPFWGKRIRFTSKLNLGVDLNMKETRRENSLQQGRRSVDTWEWTFTTRASYGFSRRVTGGMLVEIGDRRDEVREQTRKVREVGFWTEFRFD